MEKMKGLRAAFHILYMTSALLLLLYLLFATDLFSWKSIRNTPDYAEGWVDRNGAVVNLYEITAGDYGGVVVLEKALPDRLSNSEDFCFTTNNAKVTVWIDGKGVYLFEPKENLTGAGYDYAYHVVSLSQKDVKKVIRVRLESVFDDCSGGRLKDVYLCGSSDYLRMLVGARSLPFFLSCIVLFFGAILTAIFFCIPKKAAVPFNVAALGISIFLFGLWTLCDTGVLQLMTGGIYAYRVMDYLLLHLAEYPIVCFLSSVSRQKTRLFPNLMFGLSAFFLALLFGLRFLGGMDFHQLKPVVYGSYLSCVAVIAAMQISNARYCRRNNIESNRSILAVSAVALAGGGLLDVGTYIFGIHFFNSDGNFLRVGLCVCVAEVIIQFLRWWSGEHTAINRDRFINRILQYAVSEKNAEAGIKAVLEYLGTELHADRAYIFEDMHDGTFDNTYEWCREGVSAEIDSLKGLPYCGTVDAWYNEYKRSNSVLIYDLEAYRAVSENMYRVLKPQNIQTLVTAPLETPDGYIGFFGVDNPPAESMKEIAELIGLLSYFLSQLVLQRDEEKRLMHYSFFNAMTGCKNRRAIGEFEKNEFDPSRPYGFVMCDINGLKAMNDTLGHEAGDALIMDVANALKEVFGADNVYRMGGDEFAAYAYRSGEAAFSSDVERAKALLAEKNRSAAFGTVFREQGDPDYERAKAEADALMYADKRLYYQTHDRRNR